MTREEASIIIGNIPINSDTMDDCYSITEYQEAKAMAIKALEQGPCDDAISRKALLDAFGFSEKTRKWGGDHSGYNTMMLYEIQDVIESTPSVKPQEPIIDKIRAEIEEKYGDYDICEWFDDYDYEENNISEYRQVGDVSDILAIIDKYKVESEDNK